MGHKLIVFSSILNNNSIIQSKHENLDKTTKGVNWLNSEGTDIQF